MNTDTITFLKESMRVYSKLLDVSTFSLKDKSHGKSQIKVIKKLNNQIS